MEIYPKSKNFMENPPQIKETHRKSSPDAWKSVENTVRIHGHPVEIHEFHGTSTPDP